MGCLYRIDFANGKSYVGITSKTAKERLKGHAHIKSDKRKPTPVQLAILKYPDQYCVKTLAIADDWEYLAILEKRAIAAYCTKAPNGYNLTDGGDGMVGLIHTAEHRKKNSEANKGRVVSEEARKNMSAAQKGKPKSAEAKEKMRLARIGKKFKPHSEETKLKISEGGKRRWSKSHV